MTENQILYRKRLTILIFLTVCFELSSHLVYIYRPVSNASMHILQSLVELSFKLTKCLLSVENLRVETAHSSN